MNVKKSSHTITRREALKIGAAGAVGLAFAPTFGVSAANGPTASNARSIIQIWMWGGPSHLDTFDPKPEAGYDYCGPYDAPIETAVPGIRIGQMLPQMAGQLDKCVLLRGMTHGVNGHETASYMVQTGRRSGDGPPHPSVGAVVSYFKGYRTGYEGLIPPYIVVTQPQGRFSEAGFLGLKYKPFATGGDPGQSQFVVEGVVAKGISRERQEARRHLLDQLDTLGKQIPDNPDLRAFDAYRDKAYDLILGESGKVFDLNEEYEALREEYGRNSFGQACLLARRLVEQGVPYITINYTGWDTHKQHFQEMQRKLPQLDSGLSTLIRDLSDRGLLDRTVVWWGGEFGRGPKIDWDPPWNGGRSHYGAAFSMLLAGGGFKGGTVVGATDERGEQVAERPIYPWDLIGSLYAKLGIDPKGVLPHPQGYDVPILPSPDNDYPRGGLLEEVM